MSSNFRTFVIANPTSGAGSVKRDWDMIERHLRSTLTEYDVAFTQGHGHATVLTREALRAGWEMVVAVGGDGTLNEVCNGFFEAPDARRGYSLQADGWLQCAGVEPEPISPDAVLGVVPIGTGGDFRRTLGLMGPWREAVDALRGDNTRTIDMGQVGFIDHHDQIDTRYFLNIASAGLSGEVDYVVNRTSKKLGGTTSFALAVLRSFATWKNVPVEAIIDDVEQIEASINCFVTANGQFFGGGMWIAPGASLTDGQLQFVMLGDLGKLEAVSTFARVYAGTHLSQDKVMRRAVRSLSVRTTQRQAREVRLDMDGEQPGNLPAHFRVLPGSIRIKN